MIQDRRKYSDFLIAAAFASLLFLWLLTYFVSAIGLSWSVRVAEAFLFFISILYLARSRSKSIYQYKEIVFVVFVLLLVIAAMLKDTKTDYSYELYSKTVYFLILSLVLGYTVNECIFNKTDRQYYFLKFIAWASVASIFLWFLFSLIALSWSLGKTFLTTEYADNYQGFSRTLGLCLLVAVSLRQHLPSFIIYVSFALTLALIVSFNSFGAFFALIISAYLLYKGKSNHVQNSVSKIAKLGLLGIILIVSVRYFDAMLTLDSVDRLQDRFINKTNVHETYEGRYWFGLKGVEIWLENGVNFLFGPGPMHYACSVGFCDSYKHPHNFIILVLIWFGVLGVPIILLYTYLTAVAIRNVLFRYDALLVFVSSVFLYYSMLSMIGGDFEQNRRLIFFTVILWLLLRSSRQKLAPKKYNQF